MLFWSRTNAAGFGTVATSSPLVQLGPTAPRNDVFPKRTLFSTVKLEAELMAIA